MPSPLCSEVKLNVKRFAGPELGIMRITDSCGGAFRVPGKLVLLRHTTDYSREVCTAFPQAEARDSQRGHQMIGFATHRRPASG